MSTRAVILDEAMRLLAESASGDISTRAVCDAAGVTQPVLYRQFGDKDGLLAAVADAVWAQYLDGKRAAEDSADPLEDLRTGWDHHTAFALQNPHAYRLVFASTLTTRPAAMGEALELLTGITRRLAAQGRLRVSPEESARIVMAANSGLALGLILRSDEYADTISKLTREATLRGILTDADTADGDAIRSAATTMRAHLGDTDALTAAESALLDEWLTRLTDTHDN